MQLRPESLPTTSFLCRIALFVSLLTLLGCSQEVDTQPKVAKVGEALNASLPGKGSGLLWSSSTGRTSVWDTASATDFRAFKLGDVDPAWQPVGTGDFNGDGAGDLLWRNSRDRQLSIWHLTDTRVLTMTPGTANAPLGDPPLVGDLDGDGVSDLIWKSITTVSLPTPPWSLTLFLTTTWMMDPGSTTPRSVTTTSSQGDNVQGLGNFDGDSLRRADILYRAPNGAVSIGLSGGSRVFLGDLSNDLVIKGIGDFNADQTNDILWYNTVTGDVSIWVMRDGLLDSSFVPSGSHPSHGWRIQGVADVDHDGISDIIWRHSNGTVSIWEMNGPSSVRSFGAGQFADPSSSFAGVVELGPPMPPGKLALVSEQLEHGKTVARFTFSQHAQRGQDEIEVWETLGRFTTFRGRFGLFSQTTTPNVMEVGIDTAIFQNKDRACFKIRNWEQGRTSVVSSTLCLKGLAAPTAALDWRMPDMFGADRDGDGAIDLTPGWTALSSVQRDSWSVTLDACGSNDAFAGGLITTYSWAIGTPGGPPVPSFDTTSCTRTMTLAEGTYNVSLGVTTQDGRSSSIFKEVKVENHLIVSMGDSYASGEGNPVSKTQWKWQGNQRVVDRSASWGTLSDLSCHRTANAGAARAALALERSDPHSSVTYLSTACSGAEAKHLMDTPYEGVVEIDDIVQKPQVQEVKETLCANCSPQIDALVVSIGGNDIGFGDIIVSCLLGSDFSTFDECGEDTELHAEIATKINTLAGAQIVNLGGAFSTPGTYDELASLFFTHLNTRGVYMTGYPDPTRNNNGDVCDEIIFENAIPGDGEIGHDDLVWASSFVVGHLNGALDHAIDQHDLLHRWRTVPGIGDGFLFNGYCADPHMIVRYEESVENQGDILGSMHPNAAGHTVYAEQIIKALARDGIGSTTALGYVPREEIVLP